MRLDGGHPALDFVNTIYGQPDGPVEVDVLASPRDLVTFARRVGLAGASTRASRAALADAHSLREAVYSLLRAHLAGDPPPPAARAAFEAAARAAVDAATL
jgi:predicted RNA-binding Zn ribbon-like protein